MLSGGSAFGLDAPSGVQAWLREQGRGFAIGDIRIPIVCGAVLFDMLNGGDKNWGRFPPYRDLGYAAAAAIDLDVRARHRGRRLRRNHDQLQGRPRLGVRGDARRSHGRRAGRGECLRQCECRHRSRSSGRRRSRSDNEFGGLGFPTAIPPDALVPVAKGRPGENTTIAIVATDATLTKAQAKQFAVMAQDGLARAIYPAHTTLDGDTVFAAATGRRPLSDPVNELAELGAIAANVARARGGPGSIRGDGAAAVACQAGRIVTVSDYCADSAAVR